MRTTEGCTKNHTCGGVGKCITHNPGTHLEILECLCDLWHTGSNCEFLIPMPYISSSISTLMLLGALFFCWQSARRFRTQKFNISKHAYRFVDYLKQDHFLEKAYLDEMHKQEDIDIRGRGCKIHPVFEEKDEPVKKIPDGKGAADAKSVPKPSAESVRPPGTSVSVPPTRPAMTPTVAASVAAPVAVSLADPSARAPTVTTRTVTLARRPSDQLVPSDAPGDNRDAERERRQADRQFKADMKKNTEKKKEKLPKSA